MNKKSFLEFDISVSADKRRRSKRTSVSGGFEASTRECHVTDCNKEGKYRAPKSPKDLDDFFWFCLAHVKEYNNRWNYFQNHSDEEFDKELSLSKTWGRTTKPFGSKAERNKVHSDGNSHLRFGLDDPYELFETNNIKGEASGSQNDRRRKRLNLSEKKALGILGALDTMTKSEIRKLYKILIKDLHPDRNGGKRDDEERMTEVVWAWEQINKSIRFKE